MRCVDLALAFGIGVRGAAARTAVRRASHAPFERLVPMVGLAGRLAYVSTAVGVLVAAVLLSGASAAVTPMAATAGCGKAPTLTSGTHTISSGGQNRTYILSVPSTYQNDRPYRLVFGQHWLNGTANDVATGGS